MQAIILAGGLGTRLRSVVADVPKPMAPIEGKPFLAYLLDYLNTQGIKRIIFSLYYQGEVIRRYFQAHYASMEVDYVQEERPLGTGGAIVNALSALKAHDQPVFVLNGDTFFQLSYQNMYEQHIHHGSRLTLALKQAGDCGRYGKVMAQDHRILGFCEKGEEGAGLINGGVYLLHPSVFSPFVLAEQFSFEKEFLLPYLAHLQPQAFIADDYFIDIGVACDYARAIADLPSLHLHCPPPLPITK